MLCRNGLHEYDLDSSWRASNGERCRTCYLARNIRTNQRQVLKGKHAESRAASFARAGPAKRAVIDKRHYDKIRKTPEWRHLHNTARRLGLSFAEVRRQIAQGIIEPNNGRQ